MATSEPGDALPHVDGMRLRSRFLLVALTWAALLGATAALVIPGLDAGIFDANPAALPLAILWFVLMIALLLQVSHRWRPFVMGIIFMAILGMPGFLAMAVLAGYGHFGMTSTTATVVEARSRASQPPSVTFEFEDGTRELGYSLGATGGKYSSYVVPSVGSRYDVLRDPVGFLPPCIASTDEGRRTAMPRPSPTASRRGSVSCC